MRVCLISTVQEGSTLHAEQESGLLDPNQYLGKSHHEVVTRVVTTANAKSEIDDIVKEGFEFYMNYMSADETDGVTSLEATLYLESKNVTLLTGSSVFLAKHMPDIQEAALECGFRIPQDTPNIFPKVVQRQMPHRLSPREGLLCMSDDEVESQTALLKEGDRFPKVFVQDYIPESTFSIFVMEMGQEIVALPPFYSATSTTSQEVLSSTNGLETAENCSNEYQFVEDERKFTLQKAAEKVLRALGVVENAGWARVDLQLAKGSTDVYVIGVSALPLIFSRIGTISREDHVIQNKFPGGHAALIDMLLATKHMQMKRHQDRDNHIAGVFDEFSSEYDSGWRGSGLHKIQQFLAAEFEYSGTVLDVACGAGAIGTVLHEANIPAEVTGIELSKGMLDSPYIKKHYKQPIRIGPMQELIMGAGEFDHIVCFGSLQFLDRANVIAVLSRMFMLARKSISFDIDDVEEEYIKLVKEIHGELCFNANHVQAVQEFGVPKGWKLVYNNRTLLFDVPDAGLDVYGYVMRFERV